MKNNGVMILDFGSQYTKLIARRVREQNIYSEILPYNISIEKINSHHKAKILRFFRNFLNPENFEKT